jgi:1-acyl-sn-glycerol-3-phosphate acyltransferase
MSTFARVLLFAFVARLLLPILLRFKAKGSERLACEGPLVVIANHNSHLDTLVLLSLLPWRSLARARPVAAADAFVGRRGFVAWFARHILDVIPVARDGAACAKAVLAPCAAALRDNAILIFFPEGTRGAPGIRTPMKSGIAHLAELCPDVPVVPVWLHGLGEALPKGRALPRLVSCAAHVGTPRSWSGDRSSFLRALDDDMGALEQQSATSRGPGLSRLARVRLQNAHVAPLLVLGIVTMTMTSPSRGERGDKAAAFVDDQNASRTWRAREPGVDPATDLALRFAATARLRPTTGPLVDEARAWFWLGLQQERAQNDDVTRRRSFSRCVDAATRASALTVDDAGPPYYEALCRAKLGELDGVVESVWMLGKLRTLLSESYTRDPDFAWRGADRFWGTVITRTPSVLLFMNGASLDDGERFFKLSLEHTPSLATTSVLYAELMERRGDIEAARALLLRASTLHSDDDEIEAWNRFERPHAVHRLARLEAR